jgi:anti-anti-sigma regulatory factor
MNPVPTPVEQVLAAPALLVRPASDRFRDAGLALLNTMNLGEGRLVLELSETYDADSVGIAALIAMQRRARERGLVIVLRGVTPSFRELLHMTKLDSRFAMEQ